ncbi:MAG TPA: hypothetical protein VGA51_02500 [Casimicrobiaceae bacterium]
MPALTLYAVWFVPELCTTPPETVETTWLLCTRRLPVNAIVPAVARTAVVLCDSSLDAMRSLAVGADCATEAPTLNSRISVLVTCTLRGE